MKTLKRKFTFKDANHNKVQYTVEITTRNRYFTASCDVIGHSGQAQDSIKPDGENQKKLIQLWKQYHLNSKRKALPKGFDKMVNQLIDAIESEEREKKQKAPLIADSLEGKNDAVKKQNLIWLRNHIQENGNFEDVNCAIAVGLMFNLNVDELVNEVEQDGYQWKIQGVDYLCGTDTEMDEEWDKYLENYIDECIIGLAEKSARSTLENYFDREKWKQDARVDGRGHSLNRYDGREESVKFDDEWYYAYRG